jgi:spore coat protein A
MWIVDDDFEDSLSLPTGERDLPLMICDRSFDRRNQLTDPFSDDRRPPADGILAETILVNGAYMPHHRVEACRYRLRLLNVSSFRSYNLQLSNGAPMLQIATESGLMPKPIRRREIMLGPAERVEVIVDFAVARGESVELRSSKRHGGRNPTGAHTYGGALMQFQVGGERVSDRTHVPRHLRPLPVWTRKAKRRPDKQWEITIGGFFKTTWRINGRTFNPAHSEAFPKLNTTETWEIQRRPRDAPAPHRLVPARAQRQAAAGLGRLPQGDVFRLPQ